jgi:hypothetical protein
MLGQATDAECVRWLASPATPLDRGAGTLREANMINAFIIAGSVAVVESAVFAVSFAVIRGVLTELGNS